MAQLPPFKTGAKVEVRIQEGGYEHSLYPAKIVGHGRDQQHRIIEYATLKNASGTSELWEEVETENLRPKPISMQLSRYNVGDIVDCWMRGGWWTVKVVHITGPIYVVEAQDPWEFLLFPVHRLRLHMEYDDNVWFFGKVYK